MSVLISSYGAWPYILQFETILSKTAGHHGRGIYQITQDVKFSSGEESWEVREVWTVKNGQSMHLEVVGKGLLEDRIHLFFIYKNQKRYQVEPSGEISSSHLSSDWLEPYFHFRNSKEIQASFVAQKIILPPVENEKKEEGELEGMHKVESSVRLSRRGGYVSYGIYYGDEPTSGLWIQQDQFHVQLLRLLSQAEMSAKNYKKFKRGLWFPSHRDLHWKEEGKNNRVEIHLVNVTSFGRGSKVTRRFQVDKSKVSLWPEDKVIHKFYNRFR